VDTARDWRGGQSQIFLTASGLLARGHAVALACQAGGALEQRAKAAGLDVFVLRFRGDLAPAAAIGLRRAVRRFRPDVLQLNDPHAVGTGLVAAVGSGVAQVVTRRVDFHLRGRASLWKYSVADRVIAVSQAIAGILANDGLDGGRLRLVYEGVPDRSPQPGGAAVLTELGVPAGAPVIGNVAALTNHKDHATLLSAMPRVLERVPEARLVVAGEGKLRPELERQAAQLGIGDRCLFLGFRSDLDRLIPAFSVFCLSSRWEGLGTSLLDAMAFSRPIVATAAGGIPEAVVDGVTGRVVPVQDPDALADALVLLLTRSDLREAMGRAGRERFLTRFTSERMVDETLRVFGEVV